MESGLTYPPALIATGPRKGVTSPEWPLADLASQRNSWFQLPKFQAQAHAQGQAKARAKPKARPKTEPSPRAPT